MEEGIGHMLCLGVRRLGSPLSATHMHIPYDWTFLHLSLPCREEQILLFLEVISPC